MAATMAKKGGFGKFLGGLGGRPYDRLMSRLEKNVKELSGDELAKELDRLVKIVRRTLEEEKINEEDHDLLMEEIEEVHPDGKTYPRLGDEGEDFFDGENLPDAPDLELGKRENLDDLMKARDGAFMGSFGRNEYEEYRQQMAEEFFRESDEAIAAGDHYEMTAQDPSHRVFGDPEAEAAEVKRQIAIETGQVSESETTPDDTYRVDEDGTEWWQDEEGQWWFRPQGEADWFPYDE